MVRHVALWLCPARYQCRVKQDMTCVGTKLQPDSYLGPAWMGGKWERKENGEGKGGKREHFPLLVRRENGRGKKMGKENSVGPMPYFPPNFSLPK